MRDAIPEVGSWAKDKHRLLAEYVKISAAARRKFTSRSEATYLDPFCGAYRASIRSTGELIDGGSVAAWKASMESRVPFSRVFVGDINADFANGTATCLASLGAPVRHWNLPAAVSVPAMVSSLNRHGLHFALLDPYNLDLPFSAIKSLAALRHIDLMIHLSTGSMQRNLSTYTDSDNQTLDAFAPGWRERVDMNTTPLRQREQIIQHWFALLRGLQLESAPEMRRMRNSTNTTIYWLIFASRAEVARKFWAIAQTYVDGSTNDLFGGSNGRD